MRDKKKKKKKQQQQGQGRESERNPSPSVHLVCNVVGHFVFLLREEMAQMLVKHDIPATVIPVWHAHTQAHRHTCTRAHAYTNTHHRHRRT